MNQWQEFLTAHNAAIADSVVTGSGNLRAELKSATATNILADLSHQGLLEFDGNDAVAFLQGQVTNDIRQVSASNSQYAGYCTPKGRLLGIFLAFLRNDRIHLQLNRELLEPITRRLKMYVLRSNVVITDVSDSTVRIGVAGKDVEAPLMVLFNRLPQEPHAITHHNHGTLLRLPGTLPRFEIVTDYEQAKHAWEHLSQHCTPVGKTYWDWLEIQAGIPEIYPATQEAFVPQMVNLDALDGISFKKGCYTGQEIVARTHYLGKVKRRTYLAHLAASQPPHPGDSLFGSGTTEPVGQIVRVAAAPDGGFDMLAEIRSESMTTGNIYWPSPEGTPLTFRELPYPLE